MPAAHRALRHPFVAGVLVIDVQTGEELAAHTEDISACGCFIETFTPFPADTTVKVRITRGGQHMIAHGRIAYSRPKAGMGLVFMSFEPGSPAILDEWLDDLRR
jgi:hypothetical protein